MADDQVKQFLEQATQSLQSGQFQQALDLADQAVALQESDEAQLLRGVALSQLNQPDSATEAFRRAISLNAHNPKAYYNLAVHYYALGQKNEALEMAREAVRIDSKHAGARDLVTRIEAESAPKSEVQPARVMDDGSTQEAGANADPMGGPMPGGAPGPQAPYQAPVQGNYARPGYETSGVHSLQFVANMGKTWDTIAWILIVVMFAIFVLGWVTNFGQIMEVLNNPEAARRMGGFNSFGTMGAFQIILSIVGIIFRLVSLVWMILELTDRRGNWLWLLPYILCCCCNAEWLPLGIYLMAGRQK